MKLMKLKPEVGMKIVDPEFPGDVWEVIQADSDVGPIYVQRSHDGRLHHYSRASWGLAWSKGFLSHA